VGNIPILEYVEASVCVCTYIVLAPGSKHKTMQTNWSKMDLILDVKDVMSGCTQKWVYAPKCGSYIVSGDGGSEEGGDEHMEEERIPC
jgi:hypothetical protein